MWFIRTIAVLHSTMRDSEVVAAIVAGDPEGLAEAYDRYAAPLYTYCRSLLRESADAADAVQDTFVIAASRLAGLRDPNRLRPWLYAVARNECHRRLRARTAQVTTPLDEMPDVTDTSADVSGEAERDELRTLLRSAVRGLNSGEHDLIELQLRQGLDVAEIAAVLGVSRNHAHALLSRARDQLEISLGALLVARSGRKDCAALNTMLADWDGQLNVLMRKRINRHIESCPACAERKKRELTPALLLGLAPLAALPAAMPPGLREQVLRLASSDTPDATAHRASVAQRTEPFGHHGFPKPLDPPKSPWWRTRSGQAAAAAAAVAAIAALTLISVALAASGPDHHGGSAAALGLGSGPGTSIAAAGGTPGGPGGGGSSGGGSGNRPQPTVSPNGAAYVSPAPVAGGVPPGGGGSAGGSSAPPSGGSATSPGSSGSSGHPSPPASAPPSSSSASPSSPAPATSSATATASSSPSRGILTVTPTTIVLGLNGATLTLTASYGSVNWSIAESSSLVGDVTVSPTAGTLASGQSATVSLSGGSLLSGLYKAGQAGAGWGVGGCAACTLTVNPGNITVTVVLDISVSSSSSPPQSSSPPSSPPPSSPPPDSAKAAGAVGRLEN
jgi:RNA polymerase sigma factor (sigma-70 family)